MPPPPTRGMAKRTYEVLFKRGRITDLLLYNVFPHRYPCRWIVLSEWSHDSQWGQMMLYESYEEFGDIVGPDGNFMLGVYWEYERIQRVDLHSRPFGGDKVVLHLRDWVQPRTNRSFPAEKMYLWVRDGSQFVADLRAELAKVPR